MHRSHRAATVTPLLILVVCLSVAVSPTHGDGIPQPERQRPSVHARELQHWNAAPQIDWQRQPAPARRAAAPRIAAAQSHHVLGFHPYWMGTKYLAYDWSTLHTVVFFSLEISATGSISDDHGWPWTDLVAHAHDNGRHILVAATQFSSSDLTTLLGSPTHRATAVANIVNAMVAGNADGVCIDFEAIPGSRKQHFVDFTDELQSALEITKPGARLVITTPAVDWNNAYDYDELAARADYLLLMAYDYHWSGSTTSGPVAPLDGWGTYNVSWSIEDHFTWGAPADKLLLGVPYYGYRWDTTDDTAGTSTTSTGSALTYAGVQSSLPGQEEMWDAPSQTPWLVRDVPNWQQTWYDDATSLAAKYQKVIDEGLAGVGIWALGYDDPHTALWNALHDAFDQVTSDTGPRGNATSLRVAGGNPFRTRIQMTLEAERATVLRVFDVRGQVVRHLQATAAGPRLWRFHWDGDTDSGLEAAPGVYWARTAQHPGLRLIKQR